MNFSLHNALPLRMTRNSAKFNNSCNVGCRRYSTPYIKITHTILSVLVQILELYGYHEHYAASYRLLAVAFFSEIFLLPFLIELTCWRAVQ